MQWLKRLYVWSVLELPWVFLLILLGLAIGASFYAPKVYFDASSDSLLLKNDKDLEYYRTVRDRYGSDDFLILTYSPSGEIFSQPVLNDIRKLKQELRQIKGVIDITSILEVPLIKSPPVTYEDLSQGIRTIEKGNVNLALAKQEMLISPFYRGLILSKDGKSTALLIDLWVDHDLIHLKKERDQAIKAEDLFSIKSYLKKHALDEKIKRKQEQFTANQGITIEKIRNVMQQHGDKAKLYLGGVPMIAVDSINYIQRDFYVFGLAIIICITLLLFIIFKEVRWVVLPLITCLLSGLLVMGFLGLSGWPVTVVSSNFPPLLLILTFSLVIYLIVSYRELELNTENKPGKELITVTMKSKFAPCFYTTFTAAVGFGSLTMSGIQPLIDFGMIMCVGLIISFVLSFTLFPAMILFFNVKNPSKKQNLLTAKLTILIAEMTQRWPKAIIVVFCFAFVVSGIGILFLSVENRFIDYYKKSTEIYQGMEVIDRQFGGTTPLDIIVDPPPYWFQSQALGKITDIHLYLESLPHVGKVLSLATTMAILETIDPKTTTNNEFMNMVYDKMPKNVKKELFLPYFSKKHGQLRFSVRVFETDYKFKRKDLLNKIKHDLTSKFGLNSKQVKISGMLVLYNNLLQSFFKSQILTAAFVFVYIFVMFILFFRNVMLSLLALIPNIFAAVFVLGLMGWLGISLNLMTIVITAITIGIGVDDTIHYVHRYMEEYRKRGDYVQAVQASHRTVGLAMIFTSFIISLGFSVLVFSNFVPTIYFGLLTSCALLIALIGEIFLLPILICKFKPKIE